MLTPVGGGGGGGGAAVRAHRPKDEMLTAVVVVAAIAAGVTGAWSPCGFSMVETLAPAGYAGRLRTTAVACATFALGALAGGAITFGGLALIGCALGGRAPAVPRSSRSRPPPGRRAERGSCRRSAARCRSRGGAVLPLPLAAGLYGVLLGLGFTTFILSFAVWALAG